MTYVERKGNEIYAALVVGSARVESVIREVIEDCAREAHSAIARWGYEGTADIAAEAVRALASQPATPETPREREAKVERIAALPEYRGQPDSVDVAGVLGAGLDSTRVRQPTTPPPQPCAAWCGTPWGQHAAVTCAMEHYTTYANATPTVCYSTPACRAVGHPINPRTPCRVILDRVTLAVVDTGAVLRDRQGVASMWLSPDGWRKSAVGFVSGSGRRRKD